MVTAQSVLATATTSTEVSRRARMAKDPTYLTTYLPTCFHRCVSKRLALPRPLLWNVVMVALLLLLLELLILGAACCCCVTAVLLLCY